MPGWNLFVVMFGGRLVSGNYVFVAECGRVRCHEICKGYKGRTQNDWMRYFMMHHHGQWHASHQWRRIPLYLQSAVFSLGWIPDYPTFPLVGSLIVTDRNGARTRESCKQKALQALERGLWTWKRLSSNSGDCTKLQADSAVRQTCRMWKGIHR